MLAMFRIINHFSIKVVFVYSEKKAQVFGLKNYIFFGRSSCNNSDTQLSFTQAEVKTAWSKMAKRGAHTVIFLVLHETAACINDSCIST